MGFFPGFGGIKKENDFRSLLVLLKKANHFLYESFYVNVNSIGILINEFDRRLV